MHTELSDNGCNLKFIETFSNNFSEFRAKHSATLVTKANEYFTIERRSRVTKTNV